VPSTCTFDPLGARHRPIRTKEQQDVADIADLMRANLLEVFNERDAGRRRSAIARTYTTDVRFSDPEETATGHDALDAKAQQLLDEAPGFVFSPAGPLQVNHDLGYLAWDFGPEGQPPAVRGVDIALVENGLIARLYTLLLTD
jgi:SnoaL-like domain